MNIPEPLVSISCITYNHARYIRQCLDGFVLQKTTFPFEVLIHDDASTDGTADIIREYEMKYPYIIKPIYEQENQWVKGRRGSAVFNFPRAKGKYIALCEGDDYWIDPLKLQKQVDFLELHSNYSMCFHNTRLLEESSYKFNLIPVEEREYCIGELFEKWLVPTASILMKKEVIYNFTSDSKLLNGDIYMVLSAVTLGKVHGMSDVMSVYRVQDNGLTIKRQKTDNAQLQLRYIKHYQLLKSDFPEIPTALYHYKLSNVYINLGSIYLKESCIKAFYYILKALIYSPKCFLDRLLVLKHKMK